MIKIAPSILSADFSKLAQEVKDVEQGGADYIHIDVMDGHFVPNITIGPLIVEAIRPVTSLTFDVHLMIENPEKYIADFVKAGSDIITIHAESTHHLHRAIYQIKESNLQAGVVINPATPVEMIRDVLSDVDLVLLMTVNPGFGGQKFIPNVLKKIKQIKDWKDEFGYSFEIEVDGGVNIETAKACVEHGANVLVAGSAIFNEKDRKSAIQAILQSVMNG